jgi:hypothetical protein
MLWGMVEDDGGEPCQYRFRYRLKGDSLQYTDWTGSVKKGEWFRQVINGLAPNSKYSFSVQAMNSESNSAWALTKSFRTPPVGTNGLPETEIIFSDDFDDGVFHPKWQVGQSGWVKESHGELRFHGTAVHKGWGEADLGVHVGSFPEGDFEVSVDFRVPQFDGSGTRLIYLQAHSRDPAFNKEQTIGIVYSYDIGYRVQNWDPLQFSEWLYPLGNERTTFHRMKLAYSSTTEIVKGYIDDTFIGSLGAPMHKNITFTLGPDTETRGTVIDARCDNFDARITQIHRK